MFAKEGKKIDIWKLEEGQIVWSCYFSAYVIFVEREFDGDFLFKFLDRDGYCVLYSNNFLEPEGLIKELL